jgi:photosystem II stability/assembly factor-like uncharacterized protein
MNKFDKLYSIFILVFSFSASLLSQQKWQWQNPLPQGADMFAVFTLSPNRAIITGSGGTIMTTEDCGQNWRIQRLPQVACVRKYSFISENEGWIIGNWLDITTHKGVSKIFKTNNGGLVWQGLNTSIQIDFSIYRLHDIEFIDAHTGYLLANPSAAKPPEEQDPYPGLIFKSEDGGIHWTQINIGISRKYNQIVFIDSLTGFLLSQPYYSNYDFDNNMLHRTADGGKTWTTLPGKGYGIIHFIDKHIGWAGNYKTTDGGQTWEYRQFNFPPLENGIDKICFADSLIGYAISYQTILKTEDGGNSWAIQTEMKNGLLQDIQFYNSNIGYACGYGGTIYRTIDGGENWLRYGEGVTEDLEDVDFINEDIGWAVGYYGTILHTKNSGEVWEKQNIPEECDSTTHFRGVDFLDKERGWVAGGDYILNTQNGGYNWNIQLEVKLNSSGRFRDIKFIDENIGFAVGQKGLWPETGIFYKTMDGGENWQIVDQGTLPPLDEIYFVDNDYGWICGQQISLSTKDGGKSWYTDYFPEFLRYMQFTDRKHGWISSIDEGAVYRTIDGGKRWVDIPYDNRFGQFFNSFFFFNNNQGIASTFLFCNILSTEDGGLHWSYEERLPPAQLNSMAFVNDSLGWAVGTNGAIIRFNCSYFNSNNNMQSSGAVAGNYPNPFLSVTTIYFYLSQPQQVNISIYNILGRNIKIFILFDTIKGRNEINWYPKNISSGLYFIRIQCSEFTKVLRCLFLK